MASGSTTPSTRYWNDAAFRQAIRTTRKLDDVDPSRHSAIYFAGGHGAMWDFPDSLAAQRAIRGVYERGGVIAAVCHGVAALVNARLEDGGFFVHGRHVGAFTDDEERAVKLDHVVPFLLAGRLAERARSTIRQQTGRGR